VYCKWVNINQIS